MLLTESTIDIQELFDLLQPEPLLAAAAARRKEGWLSEAVNILDIAYSTDYRLIHDQLFVEADLIADALIESEEVDLLSDCITTRLVRGMMKIKVGQYHDAITTLSLVLDDIPGHLSAISALSYAHVYLGDDATAAFYHRQFSRAVGNFS